MMSNQRKACVMCLIKCPEKKLTECLKYLLQKTVYSEFLKDEEFLGNSICDACKTRLYSTENHRQGRTDLMIVLLSLPKI